VKRSLAVVALAAFAAIAASCGGGESTALDAALDDPCELGMFFYERGEEAALEETLESGGTRTVPAGTVELTISNTSQVDRTIVVFRPDLEVPSIPTKIIFVSDRDGFQPVIDVDAIDSAQLIETIDVGAASQETISFDVDPGTYSIADVNFFFCELPLELQVTD
jgi:hypothetical protein